MFRFVAYIFFYHRKKRLNFKFVLCTMIVLYLLFSVELILNLIDIYNFSSIFAFVFGIIFSLIELEIVRIIYIVDERARWTLYVSQSTASFLVSLYEIVPIMRLKVRYEKDDEADKVVLYISCFIVLILSLVLLLTGLFAARKLALLQQTIFERALLSQTDTELYRDTG